MSKDSHRSTADLWGRFRFADITFAYGFRSRGFLQRAQQVSPAKKLTCANIGNLCRVDEDWRITEPHHLCVAADSHYRGGDSMSCRLLGAGHRRSVIGFASAETGFV